jgi:hypothetical protein
MLFIAGVAVNWAYASTLAYVVDSNIGRASSAIAVNSTFRGVLGLVFAEISGPLQVCFPNILLSRRLIFFQNSIGDGGLYSIWAGLMFLTGACIYILIYKGPQWRLQEETKKVARRAKGLAKEQVKSKAELA